MNRDETFKQIEEAEQWLQAARRDYEAYKKLVRITWFPFRERKPREPQAAIIHLQQCIEKMIKAFACASGEFTHDKLMEYGHDSFRLIIDLLLKSLEIPLIQLFLNTTSGKILKQSEAQLFNHDESVTRLKELRTKTKLTSKELNEWAYELATLPKERVAKIVHIRLKAIRIAKISESIFKRIPLWLLRRSGPNSAYTYDKLLDVMTKRGFLLSDNLRAFFDNEGVAPLVNAKCEKEKLLIIQQMGSFFVIANIFTSSIVLASLTFTHAVSPRYPGNPEDLYDNKRKLNSESYLRLGLAESLIATGNLTGAVLKESEREVSAIAPFFRTFSLERCAISDSPLTLDIVPHVH